MWEYRDKDEIENILFGVKESGKVLNFHLIDIHKMDRNKISKYL
jgi:hypothetical protein